MNHDKYDFSALMRFYGVSTIQDLVVAQEEHIRRLQESGKKKQLIEVIASSPVRSA